MDSDKYDIQMNTDKLQTLGDLESIELVSFLEKDCVFRTKICTQGWLLLCAKAKTV
jgi:hypothetical protein